MELIKSFDDLISIKRKGDYALACDIDCNGQKIDRLVSMFSGSIDGCGHAIKNLMLTEEVVGDGQKIALFHELNRAEIKNLKFENFGICISPAGYDVKLAALCVEAGESIFENVCVTLAKNCDTAIPFIYDAYRCKFSNIQLPNDMLLTKYE